MSDLEDLADIVDVPPRGGGPRSTKRIRAGLKHALNVLGHGRVKAKRQSRSATYQAEQSSSRRNAPITLASVKLPPVEDE